CPKLVVAGSPGIQDSAGDVQMRLGVAVIQGPAEMVYKQCGGRAQRTQARQHQAEFQTCVFQNSVNARNSLKRASISGRASVRNRSTPNFSQQKLPITDRS